MTAVHSVSLVNSQVQYHTTYNRTPIDWINPINDKIQSIRRDNDLIFKPRHAAVSHELYLSMRGTTIAIDRSIDSGTGQSTAAFIWE